MPWNTDDDGGGNKGPWGQGPWGQGPRNQNNRPGNRGPGGGQIPPDLDELIRKGKDSFKNAIPGGGGRSTWIIPILLLGAYWIYNSLYQVQPDERGVVLRLGEYAREAAPGLHFAMWPVERMEKVRVGTVRQIDIGREGDEGQMLTSDKNIIAVPFSVQWRIAKPDDFLFNSRDPETLIRSITQSVMREVVGQTTAQLILTTGKDAVAAKVLDTTQKLLDSPNYQAGVVLTAINLGDVQPPEAVADAFAEVVRAGQNRIQLENEAQKTRNQRTQQAEGEAAKLIEDANAYKAQVVAEAQGEAARFLSVYEEYKVAKDVTRRRLFLETMENVLAKSNKVIMEKGSSGQGGVIPYLPLPEVERRREPAPTEN